MKFHYLRNVVTLKLDEQTCTGCGRCLEVCPQAVFELVSAPGRKSKAVIVDRDACLECGACQLNCPFNALSVRSGVGCANALIRGGIRGTEPECGCGSPSDCG